MKLCVAYELRSVLEQKKQAVGRVGWLWEMEDLDLEKHLFTC